MRHPENDIRNERLHNRVCTRISHDMEGLNTFALHGALEQAFIVRPQSEPKKDKTHALPDGEEVLPIEDCPISATSQGDWLDDIFDEGYLHCWLPAVSLPHLMKSMILNCVLALPPAFRVRSNVCSTIEHS